MIPEITKAVHRVLIYVFKYNFYHNQYDLQVCKIASNAITNKKGVSVKGSFLGGESESYRMKHF